MYMKTPAMVEVSEVFKVYYHGHLWTITVVLANTDGVCYKAQMTYNRFGVTKNVTKKCFVTSEYFIAKWWNHRLPEL